MAVIEQIIMTIECRVVKSVHFRLYFFCDIFVALEIDDRLSLLLLLRSDLGNISALFFIGIKFEIECRILALHEILTFPEDRVLVR